ncbi:MAG TPA: 1-(5-phosphoribosyl)-5-[(5-phosphoribosylamino)methylideneamino]imidazole-4-carboxamide isomerase [bacterium]|nr:1-(5-phosphoribosyl)-5-[(5-phosphoribosylamino)methylideneamino]imidazole-4-carboxamide isomerase [bacterium]
MFIIPAIDLIEGRCVRLREGRLSSEEVYSKEPVAVAELWELKGAKRLHIVDLDGAFEGEPQNLKIVKRIAKSIKIPIQFGGGVRSLKTIREVLDCGVEYVILGTTAISKPEFVKQAVKKFKKRIMVSIDASNLKVRVQGWEKKTRKTAPVLAREMVKLGVRNIIFTDIRRDGTLKGPNISQIKKMLKVVNIPLIISGGISSLEDIRKLKPLEKKGLSGVIIGKALYTGQVDLEKAIGIGKQ